MDQLVRALVQQSETLKLQAQAIILLLGTGEDELQRVRQQFSIGEHRGERGGGRCAEEQGGGGMAKLGIGLGIATFVLDIGMVALSFFMGVGLVSLIAILEAM